MTSFVRRLAARLLVAALALVAGVAAGAVPAAAAERCDGVWVVVDATRLGGDVRTLCAPGTPTSGLDALRLAGVSYTFVERQPGLVCTLDGQPDPCNGAPTDAYWGYWHAEAGGEWTYSTRGAGNRTPPKGSVEGWAFGAGEPPGRRPPAATAPEPESEPEPTTSPTVTPEPSASASPTPGAAPGPSAGEADTDGGAGGTDGAGSAGSSTTGTAGDDREGTDPAADDAATGTAEAAPDQPSGDASGDAPADDRAAGGTLPDEDRDTDGDLGADDPADPGVDDADERDAAENEVALGAAPDGGDGAPVGAIAGGVLVVGLAGAGLVRARRNAHEEEV